MFARASLNGEIIFIAHAVNKLYEVIFYIDRDAFAGFSGEKISNNISSKYWHHRLGHLNFADMKKLADRKMVNGLEKLNVNLDEKFCESCIMGKQAKLPFSQRKQIRSNRVLQLIHSDVCGPIADTGYDGSRYFVTFTDDYSRATMVYCIERKSQVFSMFKQFVAMSEALHGCKVAKLRSDNGGEYISDEFKRFCNEKGIQLDYTVPYNPQMNSIAERLNRTLVEKARTMLNTCNLDKKFWPEAILTSNYIKNRSPTSAYGKQFINKTPAELWFGIKPNLSNLRVFGSDCYNLIPSEKRSKLDEKSVKCIMLGYASNSAYRLWNTESNKLIIGRNVIFNENSIMNKQNIMELSHSEAVSESTDVNEFDEYADDNENTIVNSSNEFYESSLEESFHDAKGNSISDNDINHGAKKDCIGDNNDSNLRRSQRNRRQPDRYGDWEMGAHVALSEIDEHYALSAQQFVENDPLTITDAKQRNDWSNWQTAINEEYSSLIKNKTWSICDLPKGRKPVSCKWVFKLKRKSNGDIDKYKARLVARGFSQSAGFDYNETYAPTLKLTTLRILLSIAIQNDMNIHQMDVKGAFLNGELSENIYMELPEGFKNGNKVCKLNKALYGLKQASRTWNDRFNQFMLKIGFIRCISDQCIYIKGENDVKCFVLLYVDDLLIISSESKRINTIKNLLEKEFEMTNIGKVETFLGMYIEHDIERGKTNQTQYLKNVLNKFGMAECKGIATPMEIGLHLKKGNERELPNIPYRELIGCLTYATITTRPDLCASVNYFSRFQSCFTNEHLTHAKRILRYIKQTLEMKMVLVKNENADLLHGYTDSDWANDVNDRKSISGYVFKIYDNTISWASRKQTTVSLSSTEAEYMSLATGICEAKWIRGLLKELGFDCSTATIIFEDNQSCIRIAQESCEHKRTKHIDVKYNFIQKSIADDEIQLRYKQTSEQLADIMTKAIGKILFEKHVKNLNLIL